MTSDFDGKFNFMLGAFWEDRNIPYGTSQNAFAVGLITPSSGGETFDWYAERNSKAEALSFFGSVTIDLTEQLELAGGLRWTDEKKSTTVAFPNVHDIISAPSTGIWLSAVRILRRSRALLGQQFIARSELEIPGHS